MNIDTIQKTNQANSQKSRTTGANSEGEVKFSDELKNLSKESKEVEKDAKENSEKNDKTEEAGKTAENTQDPEEAINGLNDVVEEMSKVNRTDEMSDGKLKKVGSYDEEKNKREEFGLIDNNMNIQEPKDRLQSEMNANMGFNSDGQPFSEFINSQNKSKELKVSAKEAAEEKAILSTMEENIAIANKNMALEEQSKTKTVTNEHGIKKVDKNTNLTVDTIASFDTVIMDKSDVEFFSKLVNGDVLNLNEVQHAEKSARVSKTLADLLAKAMEDNKPIRINFDNDISVIIKIGKDGKISADFLPSSQIAEAYLRENLPLLKQRFDDNNIEYNELNQRKQKQEQEQDNNRRKGRNNE